jgi:hypothetical protein
MDDRLHRSDRVVRYADFGEQTASRCQLLAATLQERLDADCPAGPVDSRWFTHLLSEVLTGCVGVTVAAGALD